MPYFILWQSKIMRFIPIPCSKMRMLLACSQQTVLCILCRADSQGFPWVIIMQLEKPHVYLKHVWLYQNQRNSFLPVIAFQCKVQFSFDNEMFCGSIIVMGLVDFQNLSTKLVQLVKKNKKRCEIFAIWDQGSKLYNWIAFSFIVCQMQKHNANVFFLMFLFKRTYQFCYTIM